MANSTQRLTRSRVPSSRYAVVIIAIVFAQAVNLVIYAIGRAAGGRIQVHAVGQDDHRRCRGDRVPVRRAARGRLGLVASLSRRWPVLNSAAKIASPALALVTIALMTIPADFDTTSTMFLAAMHLMPIPVSLLALTALARRT